MPAVATRFPLPLPDDPHKWDKAVHLESIHVEMGMHCVDCHFAQDAHGNNETRRGSGGVTPGKIHSVAVESQGRYGFADGVWAGMPVRTTATGHEVIASYEMDDFAKSKIALTNDELVGERDTVKEMLA